MGRKRKKRQWRKSESTEQINAALREVSKVSTVKATANDELFYVDDRTSRAKPIPDAKAVSKKKKNNNKKRRKRTPPIRPKKKTKSAPTQVDLLGLGSALRLGLGDYMLYLCNVMHH